jgi:hypothetical protein
VTGSPRFDPLLNRKPRVRSDGEPFRILILTARRPAFNAEQLHVVSQSLADLQQWFAARAGSGDVTVQPIWRLTRDLHHALGVENTTDRVPLAEQLYSVDAVVTTPSTAMLEAMMCGLPVALLDYANHPHYVPAAWTITAAVHIDDVLGALMAPSAARMLYQDTILHDHLEIRGPATDRVRALIERMVEIGRTCRRDGTPLQMPETILNARRAGQTLTQGRTEQRFDVARLYPGHATFADRDLLALQTEVAHLRSILRRRPTQILYRALCECQQWIAMRRRP